MTIKTFARRGSAAALPLALAFSIASPAIAGEITGNGTSLKNPDGTPATNVCVSLSMGGSCMTVTSSSTFKVTFSYKIGQSVTLYFLRSDGIKTYKATLTKTVSSTYIEVGTVTLRVQ